MQELNERAARGTAGNEIRRPARGIDHRSADDPDVAAEILIRATTRPCHVAVLRWPHERRCEVLLPVQCAVVSVERIERVVDRGDEDDVVIAAADVDVADNQRLGIHLIVHEEREHLAKLLNVDIGGGQRGFVVVPA